MAYRSTNVSNQLKENLVMKVDHLLLTKGFYNIVSTDETDFLSNQLSQLTYDETDPTFSRLQTWRAPKDNWVYETDITAPVGGTDPVLPSGVWINNTFYLPSDSTYGHVVDFEGGRIIFTSGTFPAATDTVKANYSYKDVTVAFASKDQVHALHNDYFENDGVSDEVFPSGTYSTPAVYVECGGGTPSPKSIGGGITVRKTVHLHCRSNAAYAEILDDIADRLMYMFGNKLNLIDVDQMPEGIDYRGAKTAAFRDYTSMAADSSIRYMGAYNLAAERVDLFSEKRNWHGVRIDMVWEMVGVPRTG
jgi:hypothetical protein